ncbi:hypothetical protein BIFPSEUDO_02550 [Bifidobacterium pseudocatenulatum DSM 20438 = JCM 1200 = LMG 10505]|uniref:Uncharacterized protein n=1 Tax=Bifidobacterium pseudocatenulatum DSM 20438 = JCM 1200 = LMG 10505 TaxID=547043 RepID=C0BQA6_BIFPS|nr:hypothetical protein BIFPSEUDO_02550 [Bifidobacterium pseudocatenulatum DSM 20438 = JCM 1200 = LMG 10505]
MPQNVTHAKYHETRGISFLKTWRASIAPCDSASSRPCILR